MCKPSMGGAVALAALLLTMSAQSTGADPAGPLIWADCHMYRSVVAPNSFRPHGPFDELYKVPDGYPGTFKNGVELISETKPGDRDYNGGRWHVNVLKSSVPASKYANACRVEELDTADFESTTVYFQCPLIPTR